VDPGIGADGAEYPTPTTIQSLDHPACSKSLYQLHTPSSSVYFSIFQAFYLKNDRSDIVITFTNDKHWVGLGDTVLHKESDF
jgi:hypothetical protein